MCRGETDIGVNSITLGTELLEFGSTAPGPTAGWEASGTVFLFQFDCASHQAEQVQQI